jgi:membrane protein YqaA with SNARE-associated domain
MKHIVETLRALGPAGLFILAVLDGAGIPIVGGVDALLIFVTVSQPSVAYFGAVISALGSWAGSLFLFYVARKGGEAYLARFTQTKYTQRLHHWFLEYGLLTVFVTAVVPIVPMPLKIFVLSSGALGVGPIAFSAVFFGARLIRYFTLAFLARRLGHGTLPYLASHIWELAGIAVALFLLLFSVIKLMDRRHRLERLAADEEIPT